MSRTSRRLGLAERFVFGLAVGVLTSLITWQAVEPASAIGHQGQMLSHAGASGCAIDNEGQIWCWGGNQYGQMGNGTIVALTTDVYETPTRVVLPDNAASRYVNVGWNQSRVCAITMSSQLYCWGRNTATPTLVTLPNAAIPTSVSSSSVATCALASGTVYCWGSNTNGELGRTSDTNIVAAIDLPAGTYVSALTSGGRHHCALTSERKLYCWGANDQGQLATSSSTAYSAQPLLVNLPDSATAVSSGELHSCVTTVQNRVYCWGDGLYGQLSGSYADSYSPVQVSLPAGFAPTRVFAGASHSCALALPQSLFCWGEDSSYGIVGGSSPNALSPVASRFTFAAGERVLDVALGNLVTCVLTDQRTRCVGYNANGQLGDGSQATKSSPVLVLNVSNPTHQCTDVSTGVVADYSGWDLRYCDFTGKDLRGSNLASADLRHTTFRHVITDGASLQNADFGFANLTSTDFRAANVSGISLASATYEALGPPVVSSSRGLNEAIRLDVAEPLNNVWPISNYEYQLDGGVWTAFSPPDTATPVVIGGLTNGTTYAVRLRATTTAPLAGESTTATSVSPQPIPRIPRQKLLSLESSTVQMSVGNDSLAGALTDTFTVNLFDSSGRSVASSTIAATALSWQDDPSVNVGAVVRFNGLTRSETYTLQSVARNTYGVSETSTNLTFVAADPPSAPTGLSVALAKGGTADIAFTAPENGGAPITNYEYRLSETGAWTALSPAATVSPLRISGLTDGETYTVRLRAVNSTGAGAQSAAVIVALPAAPSQAAIVFETVTSDRIAFKIELTSVGGQAISRWQYDVFSVADNAVGISGSGPPSVGETTVFRIEINSLRYSAGYIHAGKPFKVRARASNTAVFGSSGPETWGAWSEWTAERYLGDLPSAPDTLTVVAGEGAATINFTAGSDGYVPFTNYEYELDQSGNWSALSPVDTSTPVTIGSLDFDQQYSIRLRAVNPVGAGSASESVSVTTLPSSNTSLSAIRVRADAMETLTASSGNSYFTSVSADRSSVDLYVDLAGQYRQLLLVNGETATSGVAVPVSVGTGTTVVSILVKAQNGVDSATYTVSVSRAAASQGGSGGGGGGGSGGSGAGGGGAGETGGGAATAPSAAPTAIETVTAQSKPETSTAVAGQGADATAPTKQETTTALTPASPKTEVVRFAFAYAPKQGILNASQLRSLRNAMTTATKSVKVLGYVTRTKSTARDRAMSLARANRAAVQVKRIAASVPMTVRGAGGASAAGCAKAKNNCVVILIKSK